MGILASYPDRDRSRMKRRLRPYGADMPFDDRLRSGRARRKRQQQERDEKDWLPHCDRPFNGSIPAEEPAHSKRFARQAVGR